MDHVDLDKMVSRILLLLILTSSVCCQDRMNETQSFYEAVENHSVTLEWTFTLRTQIQNCEIYCDRFINRWTPPLFHMEKGVQIPDYLDPDFAGRVQFDEHAFREGQFRLSVSRLRTEDSGLYRCKVDTDDGYVYGTCQLSVSAAANETQTLRPGPERPGPERPGSEKPRPKIFPPGVVTEQHNKATRITFLPFSIFNPGGSFTNLSSFIQTLTSSSSLLFCLLLSLLL